VIYAPLRQHPRCRKIIETEKEKIGKTLDGKSEGKLVGNRRRRSLRDSVDLIPDACMGDAMGFMVGVTVF
jgi:hypothetical protein